MTDDATTDPAEGRITTEVRERLLLIGIDRPAKLNGFTPDMWRQASEAFTRLDPEFAGAIHVWREYDPLDDVPHGSLAFLREQAGLVTQA